MHVLIVAIGAPADLPARERVPEVDLVLAANSGAANARRLGLRPSVIIDDMDSIDATDKIELEAAGLQFITPPVKKDATDLELGNPAVRLNPRCQQRDDIHCGASLVASGDSAGSAQLAGL